MFGGGFIRAFSARALQEHRHMDTIDLNYSRTPENA